MIEKDTFIEMQMVEEFFKSEEKEVYDNLHRLKANLKILERNFLELRKRNKAILNKTKNQTYWSSTYPHQRINDHVESTRLILNYLSNAKTVIDSSRTYNKIIENSIYENQFEELKDAFVSDPMIKFILDLRNFLSHQGYLDFGIEISANRERTSSYIYLDKEHLKKYKKGWSKSAKVFISNSEKKILIFNHIEDFHCRLKMINSWLYLRLVLLKKEDIQTLLNESKKLIYTYDTKFHHILSLNRYLNKIINQHG